MSIKTYINTKIFKLDYWSYLIHIQKKVFLNYSLNISTGYLSTTHLNHCVSRYTTPLVRWIFNASFSAHDMCLYQQQYFIATDTHRMFFIYIYIYKIVYFLNGLYCNICYFEWQYWRGMCFWQSVKNRF